jgi:colanic acid/amylovoran biosynthesis glycosyltransferase
LTNIIIFVDTFPSLSETFISNKVRQLSQHGMHVIVFCVNHNSKLFTKLFDGNSNVEVTVLNRSKLISFLFLHPYAILRSLFKGTNVKQRLFRQFRLMMIRKFKPDILHFEFSGIGVDYLQEIKHLECKKVVSCRGSAEKVKLLVHEERKEKFRELLSAVDAVHCVSDDMRTTILPYCDNPEKIFVNYPSIDTAFFTKETGLLQKNSADITILSVGRLTFQKGFSTGLQAAHILKQSGIKFKWVIVGSGPDYEEMIYMLYHYGLNEMVELAGTRSVEEIRTLMMNAQIFFLPSVYEGIANVALEAMSMELPVVATRSGGMQEVVIDGENGLLAEVYDHVVLAKQLERLCVNKELRDSLGKEAADTIRSKFDISFQTEQYLKIYGSLLRKPIVHEEPFAKKINTEIPVINSDRKPLHIGVILPEFPTISETFFVNKVIGLCKRGHKVTVFGSTMPSDHSAEKLYGLNEYKNLQMFNLNFKSSLLNFLRTFFLYPGSFLNSFHPNLSVFRRRLHINLCKASTNRHHCDIYHFGYSGTAIFYQELFDSFKGKTVISCRGTAENVKLVTEKERVKKLKELFKKADKIHCVSCSMAQTIKKYGAPSDKIFVNHPAIDTDFFIRNSSYTQHKQVVILSIGRLVFQKGFMIGLLAVKELKEKYSSFVWKIAGEGPELEELTSHVHSLGLTDHVKLLGKKDRNEIKKLYEDADIYFLPSVSEGLANAVLEAMSMSLPVVSSDVGGMTEAITHNADGKLCKNYDYEEMAQQLLELCGNFELRKKLGEAARLTAVQRFDIKRYIDVFEENYYYLLK